MKLLETPFFFLIAVPLCLVMLIVIEIVFFFKKKQKEVPGKPVLKIYRTIVPKSFLETFKVWDSDKFSNQIIIEA